MVLGILTPMTWLISANLHWVRMAAAGAAMSKRVYASADHHLMHSNIINFKRWDEVTPLRDFKSIEEHDETIIARHNAVVRPQDYAYFLGDVCLKAGALELIRRFNGHKRLVMGNHDICDTEDYLAAGFEKVMAYRVWPKHKIVFSHIPIHEQSARRWESNVHGHTHDSFVVKYGCDFKKQREIDRDPLYRCVSMEQINYTPIMILET